MTPQRKSAKRRGFPLRLRKASPKTFSFPTGPTAIDTQELNFSEILFAELDAHNSIRPQSARDPTVRDRHIAQIRSNGRMAWQVATGYNQRSRIETQIGRWKGVIGRRLQSRSFSRQITEIQLGQKVLNTMTALGRPVFERIA